MFISFLFFSLRVYRRFMLSTLGVSGAVTFQSGTSRVHQKMGMLKNCLQLRNAPAMNTVANEIA